MNSNQRTQCNCQIGLKNFDNCPMSLQWLSQNYNMKRIDDLKKDYQKLLDTNLPDQRQWQMKVQKQIERDLQRTYPSEPFFKEQVGLKALERLLYCIALYDMKVGYVQGMNFLVGALLFHSDEYVAFWNYVTIYERLELRDIYLENLPGLAKHIQIIEMFCLCHQKQLYDHLRINQIQFQSFCIPWFLSLLAMVIPIQRYDQVFQQLLNKGWPYFYQMILTYLKFSNYLQYEGGELLMLITSSNKQSDEDKEKWSQIINEANKYQIDKKFIDKMLESFNIEKQSFFIRKNNNNY